MPNTELRKSDVKTLSRVYVVVGIIKNNNNEVLVSKRHIDQHQGGLWEFPGGKVEADEEALEALQRELKEELGIYVGEATPFKQIEHEYSDKAVLLDFWLVQAYQGDPQGLEGQEVRWVAIKALSKLEFPAANVAIVDALANKF